MTTSNADLNFFKRSKSMCFVPEAESNPFEVSYQLLIILNIYKININMLFLDIQNKMFFFFYFLSETLLIL